jgi:hypothetical protein
MRISIPASCLPFDLLSLPVDQMERDEEGLNEQIRNEIETRAAFEARNQSKCNGRFNEEQ